MTYAVHHWLPGPIDQTTGKREPPTPCPHLLTVAEAARYLRLDEGSTDNPERSMLALRTREGIETVKLGTSLHFTRDVLDALIKEKTKA